MPRVVSASKNSTVSSGSADLETKRDAGYHRRTMRSHGNPLPGPSGSALGALLLLAPMLLLAGCQPEGGASDGSPENPDPSPGSGESRWLEAGFIASVDREDGFVTIEARGTDGAKEGEFVAVFRDDRAIARLQIFEVTEDGARAKVLSGLSEIEIDAPIRKPRGEASTPGWPFGAKR